jgi:hypothetical protein
VRKNETASYTGSQIFKINLHFARGSKVNKSPANPGKSVGSIQLQAPESRNCFTAKKDN